MKDDDGSGAKSETDKAENNAEDFDEDEGEGDQQISDQGREINQCLQMSIFLSDFSDEKVLNPFKSEKSQTHRTKKKKYKVRFF